MIRIHLSESEKEELQKLKKEHSHAKVRLKAEVILLKNLGYDHKKTAEIANISQITVKNYVKLYKKEGIFFICNNNHYDKVSKLEPYKDKIRAHFEKNPIFSINHGIEEIEKLTGHKISPTRTRVFMKQLGLKFLKTGAIPAKQAEEKKQEEQEEFKKKF